MKYTRYGNMSNFFVREKMFILHSSYAFMEAFTGASTGRSLYAS